LIEFQTFAGENAHIQPLDICKRVVEVKVLGEKPCHHTRAMRALRDPFSPPE
jgi:hypothetical protein